MLGAEVLSEHMSIPVKMVHAIFKPSIFFSSYQFLNRAVAFLIGSIDEINQKISKLDRKLQNYTELVIESRASDDIYAYVRPPSAQGKELYQKRGLLILPTIVC